MIEGIILKTYIQHPITHTHTCAVDLSAIPKTTPSLGLQVGRARRDLAISRSISKRRPASQRKALFLDLDESEKLSGARVTLSDSRPVRRSTLPAQVREVGMDREA